MITTPPSLVIIRISSQMMDARQKAGLMAWIESMRYYVIIDVADYQFAVNKPSMGRWYLTVSKNQFVWVPDDSDLLDFLYGGHKEYKFASELKTLKQGTCIGISRNADQPCIEYEKSLIIRSKRFMLSAS
jgi:hypothetical protein